MKKKIIIGVAGVLGLALIVGGSVAAALHFTGALKPQPQMAAAMPVELPPEETYYYNLQPEFVVNFQGRARVKFMMVEISVATHDEMVLTTLSDHDPELRNAILNLLSEQEAESLKSAAGKQVLRDDALVLVEEIVAKHYKAEKVHDVFITRLVMQ